MRARRRITDERGFTLIELLVVILIIAVLAEIAIPSFLGQQPKAQDAAAKSAVQTAQTAIETFRLQYGDYCSATPAGLVTIEPTLSSASGLTVSACPGGDHNAYALSVTSRSSLGSVYTVSVTDGATERSCAPAGGGGCSEAGSW